MKTTVFFKVPIPAAIKPKIKLLKSVAEETLKSIRNKNFETSIIFVNAAEIKKINKQFLDKNRLTDVIAFNYPTTRSSALGGLKSKGGANELIVTPWVAAPYLGCATSQDSRGVTHEMKFKEPIPFGDVFICMDQAKKQAASLNHSLLKELAILTVHGCLHLKGMEDGTKSEKAEMDKKTDFYIKKHF
ncbi:MAG: rRNA maturation RNase YbeY [Elusimicrobiota bacterium]|nr:rRNA maturation RNase YbeY [Elusimicrobiota bacterium]